MAWPVDPAVKNACYFITERERAFTREFELTRDGLIQLRRNVAAGLIAPTEALKRLKDI